MVEGGKKVWYFADGYLPAKNPASAMEAHEALMLFNTSNADIETVIDIYFSDCDPIKNIKVTVPAERIIALRMDHPEDLNGAVIPYLTQYAIRITAAASIVCQFGRLDTTQEAMAYYLCPGYAE
ncbi:MAG: sensory rhodopsin transducer [Lentisphaeria bacterium]|nr:sensory rhodopsin transducer [Lentisphaeria bacterium]